MLAETLSRTVTERVTETIRSRILTGGYAPGAPLRQDAVAAELGVSRIPLREALNHLQAEGLVEGAAHRGFVVRGMGRAEAEEIFRLRLLLEPCAVAEGARRASAEDHLKLARQLDRLKVAYAGNELDKSAELNRVFHVSLTLPDRRRLTAELLNRLHAASQRYVNLHLTGGGRNVQVNIEHQMIYDAWRAGDGAKVAGLTTDHIIHTREVLMAALNA